MTSACPHLAHATLKQPPSSLTRPEECSQCFDNQDSEHGIDICLDCFNGGCPRLHAQAHADRFGPTHSLAINIKRVRKPQATSAKRVGGSLLRLREHPELELNIYAVLRSSTILVTILPPSSLENRPSKSSQSGKSLQSMKSTTFL